MAAGDSRGRLWLRGDEEHALAHVPDAIGFVIMHWSMFLEIGQQWSGWQGISNVCPQVDTPE
jgi:hypothetical protein